MKQRIALAILAIIVAASLFAPALATHDPQAVNLGNTQAQPSTDHLLGTDLLGRDIFSRLLFGGRHTLGVAASATVMAAALGMILGIVATRVEFIFTSMIDALLAIPSLLIALVTITLLENSTLSIIIAVGIAGVAPFARTTRDSARTARHTPHIEGAISIGATPNYILFQYVLRDALPQLIAFTTITFSWSILNGAALTFLGFAGDIRQADWGIMLANGRAIFNQVPTEALSAGMAIALTVGAVNQLVDH